MVAHLLGTKDVSVRFRVGTLVNRCQHGCWFLYTLTRADVHREIDRPIRDLSELNAPVIITDADMLGGSRVSRKLAEPRCGK